MKESIIKDFVPTIQISFFEKIITRSHFTKKGAFFSFLRKKTAYIFHIKGAGFFHATLILIHMNCLKYCVCSFHVT